MFLNNKLQFCGYNIHTETEKVLEYLNDNDVDTSNVVVVLNSNQNIYRYNIINGKITMFLYIAKSYFFKNIQDLNKYCSGFIIFVDEYGIYEYNNNLYKFQLITINEDILSDIELRYLKLKTL